MFLFFGLLLKENVELYIRTEHSRTSQIDTRFKKRVKIRPYDRQINQRKDRTVTNQTIQQPLSQTLAEAPYL